MFTVQKMTLKLENDGVVEIDLNHVGSPIVSSTVPLTPEEEAQIAFRVGVFWGGGHRAWKECNF